MTFLRFMGRLYTLQRRDRSLVLSKVANGTVATRGSTVFRLNKDHQWEALSKAGRRRQPSPGQLGLFGGHNEGDTKVENGVTYRLNSHSRWERMAGNEKQAQTKSIGQGVKVGDQFNAPEMFDFYPQTYEVKRVEDGLVHVGYANSGMSHTSMPEASWEHFKNDLSGKVEGPPSSNPLINAVISGEAKPLGKGNSGLVFRHEGKIIKVGTTVPFQPLNPGHRSPEEAIANLKKEHDVCQLLRSKGVPGIPKTEFIVHGDKGFLIRDEMDMPNSLTPEQLDKVDKIVRRIHGAGYAIQDEIQVGLINGEPYMLDVGDAQPLKGKTKQEKRQRIQDDEWRLSALFNRNKIEHLISQAKEIVSNRRLYRELAGESLPPQVRPNAIEVADLLDEKLKQPAPDISATARKAFSKARRAQSKKALSPGGAEL